MSDPLLSIIVPSYNQGRFIGKTLESIFAQDYRRIEVLVVDGASTDETVAVLQSFSSKHPEFRWWSEPDSGVAEAVNKGLARARGEFASIQSSDDLYLPGAFTSAIAVLRRQPELGLVYSDAIAIEEDGTEYWRSHWPAFSLQSFMARLTRITQPTAFFRLELARAAGGWDARYFIADRALWQRLVFRTQVLKVDEYWAAWRRQPEQRDRQKKKMWDSYWLMVRECPELRRAPLSVRRAALAGAHSLVIPHAPFQSPWRLAYHLWCALLLYPPIAPLIRPKALLIPGLRRIKRLLKRTGGK